MAQFNLGVMYDAGCGVPKDHLEAKVWRDRSAENGNRLARDLFKDSQSSRNNKVAEKLIDLLCNVLCNPIHLIRKLIG